MKYDVQCESCRFRYKKDGRSYSCSALKDESYKQARDGVYECPFYKEKKEEDK